MGVERFHIDLDLQGNALLNAAGLVRPWAAGVQPLGSLVSYNGLVYEVITYRANGTVPPGPTTVATYKWVGEQPADTVGYAQLTPDVRVKIEDAGTGSALRLSRFGASASNNDNIAAFQAAQAALPAEGGGIFLDGQYPLQSLFKITKPLALLGNGGNYNPLEDKAAPSRILTGNTTGRVLHIDSGGVRLAGFSLESFAASPQAGNAGIYITSGMSEANLPPPDYSNPASYTLFTAGITMRDVVVSGFHRNLEQVNGWMMMFDNVWLHSFVDCGLLYENRALEDGGDSVWLGGQIFAGRRSGLDGFRQLSGGGFKMVGLKINATNKSNTDRLTNGVNLNVPHSVIFKYLGGSIENYTGTGIKAANFRTVTVEGVDFAPYFPNTFGVDLTNVQQAVVGDNSFKGESGGQSMIAYRHNGGSSSYGALRTNGYTDLSEANKVVFVGTVDDTSAVLLLGNGGSGGGTQGPYTVQAYGSDFGYSQDARTIGGYLLPTELSTFYFTTNATSLQAALYTTGRTVFGAAGSVVYLFNDSGQYLASYGPSADGQIENIAVPLPGTGSRTFFLMMGGQARLNEIGEVQGTTLVSVTLPAGTSFTKLAPVKKTTEIAMLVDSIGGGQGGTVAGRDSAYANLRSPTRGVTLLGYGSHRLENDIWADADWAATKAKILNVWAGATNKIFYVQATINSWSPNTYTPTQLANKLGQRLADLKASEPAALLYVQTALITDREDAVNTGGVYKINDYRVAFAGLASSSVTIISGPSLMASAATTEDGIHPTTAGYAEIYGNLNPLLSSATPAAADMLLLAGQSNVVGYARNSEIPAGYTPELTRQFQRVYIWNPGAGAFQRLQLTVNNLGAGTDPAWIDAPLGFGPEIGLAQRWEQQNAQGNLYLVKCAQGSTDITQWAKGSTLYNEFKARVANAKAALQTAALTATVRGVYWGQGETKAAGETIASYQTALAQLVSDWQTDGLIAATTRRVIMEARNYPDSTAIAQQNYVNSDPTRTFFLDTTAYGVNDAGDTLHYNAPSMLKNGGTDLFNLIFNVGGALAAPNASGYTGAVAPAFTEDEETNTAKRSQSGEVQLTTADSANNRQARLHFTPPGYQGSVTYRGLARQFRLWATGGDNQFRGSFELVVNGVATTVNQRVVNPNGGASFPYYTSALYPEATELTITLNFNPTGDVFLEDDGCEFLNPAGTNTPSGVVEDGAMTYTGGRPEIGGVWDQYAPIGGSYDGSVHYTGFNGATATAVGSGTQLALALGSAGPGAGVATWAVQRVSDGVTVFSQSIDYENVLTNQVVATTGVLPFAAYRSVLTITNPRTNGCNIDAVIYS